MSVKKNLTVATLAALLAVPAFGATNANAASQLNTPTGRLNHAYEGHPAGTLIYDGHDGIQEPGVDNGALGHGYDNNHPLVNIPAKYVSRLSSTSRSDNWTNHVGSSIGRTLMNKVKSLGGTYNNSNDTEVLNYGGHHYELTGTASGVLIDGHSATDAQALSMLNKSKNSSNTSNLSHNDDSSINHTNNNLGSDSSVKTTTDNGTSNTTNNSNSNQYTSKSNLPQTGENDITSKAMAMGAVTLGASASLMALSIAKKHKQNADLETVTPVEPAVNNGDGKDNTESNADKSVYHMIMGDTFKSISNDLKQM